MLILPYSDGFRINFHQFRQRVLQTPCNGYGRTQIDIKLWKFLRRQFGCRIHRRTCFGNNHIADLCANSVDLSNQFHCHLFGFPTGSPISDGNMRNTVFLNELAQYADGVFFLFFAIGGIDHRSIQYLSRTVYHSDFTAHAIPRVKPHRHLPFHWRLHE